MSNRRKLTRPGRVAVGAHATLRPGVPRALAEALVAQGMRPCPDCTGEGGVVPDGAGEYALAAEHDSTCPHARALEDTGGAE